MARMTPTPLYDPSKVEGAYQLRYSWSAWPSAGRFPPHLGELIDAVRPLWEQDGLRVLEYRCSNALLQILFSTRPDIAPQLLASRAKGRLDHAARQRGAPLDFSRKLSVTSVGDNTREDIEIYIARQVVKESFADRRFEEQLAPLTMQFPELDLSQPTETVRGRYWYNLHLVLVVARHDRLLDVALLTRLRDATLQIAKKKQHAVAQLAVMPSHVHVALRALPEVSPLDIVYAYQNNLAHMLECGRLWAETYYVGTFGEYSMQAVRRVVERG